MNRWKVLIWWVVIGGVCACKSLIAGDLREAPQFQVPNVKAKEVIGKKQTEGHTCGFHCLEAIYEAHGVNPGKADLRTRLGVDKAALPFAKDSTGSLHPDIYRVAFQDGFLPETLDLENPYCEEKLRYHLESGRLAMALFKKKDSGILHWVILSDLSQERIRIVDSLYVRPYRKPFREFLEKEVLSVIMFSVPKERSQWKIGQVHRSGVAEMNRVRKRMGKRK